MHTEGQECMKVLKRVDEDLSVVLIRFAKILGEKPPIFMKFTPGFFQAPKGPKP